MRSILIEQAKSSERAGRWDEAVALYEQALSHLPVDGGAAQAAELLRRIGIAHVQRGALEVAIDVYEASLAVAELNELPAQMSKVLNCMGVVEHLRGEVSAARELYTRARRAAEELQDHRLAAMLDLNLGALANIRGDLEDALASYSSALDCYRKMDDGPNAARALNNLGKAYLDMGSREAAHGAFGEAAELAEAAGDMHLLGTVELNRAELHLREHRYEEARERCARALDLFNTLRAKTAIAEAYKFFGVLYRQTRSPEQAGTHLAMALGLAEAGEDRLLQAETQIEWAVLHLEEGREQEGITYLNRALRLFGEMQAQREVHDIQQRLEKMEGLYLPAVQAWSARMSGLDPHAPGHLERVAGYSYRLGQAFGLPEWELTVLRVGALLHDIGKTVLPEAARREQASPRDEGSALWKLHTIAGDSITRDLDFPREVQMIVRSHHEHVAGTGYPDALRGEWIPLGARIVCVADAFDALTQPEGSQPRLTHAEALAVMSQDVGRIYDPEVFDRLEDAVGCEPPRVRAA